MEMNKALRELMSTMYWDVSLELLQTGRAAVQKNLDGKIPFLKKEQRDDVPYLLSSRSKFSDKDYVVDGDAVSRSEDMEVTDTFITVIDVEGPILRNGGACAYGSKEHRDIILRSVEKQGFIGLFTRIDSGGGSAYAKEDYQQALDAVRESGRKSIALIDGTACSAAYALACMHDVVYVVNASDKVGSIGTLAAGYTRKNGDVNAVTQERYFEVYADNSPYKNKGFREMSNGNEELIKQEVDRLCIDFRTLVRTYRPQVTEEQLEGRVYRAADVMGTLVDGVSNTGLCIQEIIDSAQVSNETNNNTNQTAGQPANSQQTVVPQNDESLMSAQINNNKSRITMKEYPHLMSALALNELVSDKENGVYLHESLCETLEDFCATAERNKGIMDAKIAETTKLNTKIAELKSQHEQELNDLKTANDQELELLKQEHATSLTGKEDGYKTKVQELETKVKDLQDDLTAKEEEIKQLSEAAIPAPVPEAPQTNEVKVTEQEHGYETKPVIRPEMTYAEKKEALSRRKRELEQLTKN